MKISNQRGEITVAILTIAIVGSLLAGIFIPKLGSFSLFGEKTAAKKKASFTIQKETRTPILVESANGNTVAVGEKTELYYNTGMDEFTPRLTLGEKIGNLFYGLTTTTILIVFVGLLFFPIPFIAFGVKKYLAIKQALKNTVVAIRQADPVTYEALKPKLAAAHDKKDKIVIDKIKAEIH